MWDRVDQFYIITYNGSPRIENCKNEILHWNIPPEKLTWNIAPKMEIPTCAMSSAVKNHIDAYRDAKKNGYSNIFILEDDFIVYDHLTTISEINIKTDYFLKNYPDYDIFYYGYLPLHMDQNYNDFGIVKMCGLLLHAYLINEKFYSMFFDLDPEKCVNMCCPFMKQPHDVWAFSLQFNQRRSSYAVYPQLVFQNNMPLPALFKKDNTRKLFFKNTCNVMTDLCYNLDIYKKLLFIFILIIVIGKKIK